MFSNNVGTTPDPLGIALRQRAREHSQQFADNNRELGRANGSFVNFSNLGPLTDPAMDAFKQAIYESGADKIGAEGLTPSQFGQSTAGVGQVPLEGLMNFTKAPMQGRQPLQGSASVRGLKRAGRKR